jgi:putative two-component system response regulator
MTPRSICLLVARAAHAHDEQTLQHSTRMIKTSSLLAESLGLSHEDIELVEHGAMLHDIGKNVLPDVVIMKPGRLSPQERRQMTEHTVYGHDLLKDVRQPVFDAAAQVALCHHENFDGSGYPRGLSGSEIPLTARIVAVADVYDALRSDRPYKTGMDHAGAMEVLLRGDDRTSPGNFDPTVLEAFSRQNAAISALYVARPAQPGGPVATAYSA